MTDQELKIDILRKNAVKYAVERGYDAEEVNQEFDQLLKEKDLIDWVTFSMDEWAGVISARIDDSDREEDHEELNYRHGG